ncbi:response regulator [Crocosphaera sp. UHCC 0190]|uniref:response regulator n=1 Tax=Crocosphaera sp. UHCC 0190 TaxID=3110246 RepID=UPI002B1F300A|nr:response regulator [Crocosphaera sp. UHCC 0190]MEA5510850.1 response regulator [Crocosphaera sp. UHCC 0190]
MPTHKILVIDDSKVIRMRVKDMLPEGNFKVLEAKDGVEGYNLIRSEKPSLIMLDFLLPKMSGWDVYQEVQKEYDLKKIPLVLMSGRKEEVVEKLNEPFEYFSFIEKPFEKKQLLEAIKDAMAKARKHPQPQESDSAINQNNISAKDTLSMAQEIITLRQQVNQMQGEIDLLKKQLRQVLGFLQQKH